MSIVTERPTGLVTLVVRFGKQTRFRCARCHHFFKPVPGASLIQCQCRASYEHVADDTYAVIGWPE